MISKDSLFMRLELYGLLYLGVFVVLSFIFGRILLEEAALVYITAVVICSGVIAVLSKSARKFTISTLLRLYILSPLAFMRECVISVCHALDKRKRKQP
jgi:hypothetical protein